VTAELPGLGLPASPPPAVERPEPEPLYGAVEDWVNGQFLPMFRRPLGGEFRWGPPVVAAC
jgi:hypothetical protein